MPIQRKTPSNAAEWKKFMRTYLRAIMLLRGYDHNQLAEALSSKFGIEMHYDQLRKLTHRGTFKAEFLIQCVVAMGGESLEMPRFESDDSHPSR